MFYFESDLVVHCLVVLQTAAHTRRDKFQNMYCTCISSSHQVVWVVIQVVFCFVWTLLYRCKGCICAWKHPDQHAVQWEPGCKVAKALIWPINSINWRLRINGAVSPFSHMPWWFALGQLNKLHYTVNFFSFFLLTGTRPCTFTRDRNLWDFQVMGFLTCDWNCFL